MLSRAKRSWSSTPIGLELLPTTLSSVATRVPRPMPETAQAALRPYASKDGLAHVNGVAVVGHDAFDGDAVSGEEGERATTLTPEQGSDSQQCVLLSLMSISLVTGSSDSLRSALNDDFSFWPIVRGMARPVDILTIALCMSIGNAVAWLMAL
jgi:hypothetical protein